VTLEQRIRNADLFAGADTYEHACASWHIASWLERGGDQPVLEASRG
jgi:hypothetical protein